MLQNCGCYDEVAHLNVGAHMLRPANHIGKQNIPQLWHAGHVNVRFCPPYTEHVFKP